ncbi:MAG: alpha/beta fold hydrolase [Desulfurococcaceae archaeon]
MIVLILIAILVFLIVILIISTIASKRFSKPPRLVLKWSPSDLGLKYEPFEYITFDGLLLKGWFIRKSNDKVVVLIHGYTSSKWDEDYIKPAIEVLSRVGYSILAVDLRAHGESDGDVTTLGYIESDDVVGIVNALRNQGFNKIALYGYSMGGATALLASTKTTISALILDSPYVDIRESGRRWVKRVKGILGLLLRISHPIIIRLVAMKTHVDPSKLVMTKYANQVKAPVLLIAPEKDDLISIEEYRMLHRELEKSGLPVEVWYVNTTHVGAWRTHRDEYTKKLLSFLAKYL